MRNKLGVAQMTPIIIEKIKSCNKDRCVDTQCQIKSIFVSSIADMLPGLSEAPPPKDMIVLLTTMSFW